MRELGVNSFSCVRLGASCHEPLAPLQAWSEFCSEHSRRGVAAPRSEVRGNSAKSTTRPCSLAEAPIYSLVPAQIVRPGQRSKRRKRQAAALQRTTRISNAVLDTAVSPANFRVQNPDAHSESPGKDGPRSARQSSQREVQPRS